MGDLTDDFMAAIENEMAVQGEKMITRLAKEVDSRGITNRGSLRQGFLQRTTRSGTRIQTSITGVSYANFVAKGTGPAAGNSRYRPPEPPLKRWVETKISPPQNQLDQVTFLVRQSIEQHGTPTSGSPIRGRNDYVRAALEKGLPDLARALIASGQTAISDG